MRAFTPRISSGSITSTVQPSASSVQRSVKLQLRSSYSARTSAVTVRSPRSRSPSEKSRKRASFLFAQPPSSSAAAIASRTGVFFMSIPSRLFSAFKDMRRGGEKALAIGGKL